uniref:Ig-like domain-containing protein n=1 Tax=Astyanax mexicanus TaxID=7994 RepID=A0A8B9GVW4_ASTMX
MFSPFVNNNSHCGLLEFQSLRNDFVTFFRLTDVSNFVALFYLSVFLILDVVNLGDSVTIQCHLPQKRITTMVWYKQSVGQNPRPLAMVYNYVRETKFEDEFQNGRFNVYPEKGSFHLNIAAVGQEDTGAYYCGIVFLNELQFVSWTFLMPPVLELVHPGHSISLECTVFTKTCSEDHSVYWFRHAAGESHPGIIVTHGDSSSPCTRSSETVSPTQSCIYKLPKNNLTACGEILFGNGTALKLMVFIFTLYLKVYRKVEIYSTIFQY